MRKNKNLYIGFGVTAGIIILGIIICIITLNFKNKDNKLPNGDVSIKEYNLSKKNQTLDIDNHVTLKFNGKKVDGKYEYLLDIYLDNVLLDQNTIFNNQNSPLIKEETYTYFDVDKVDNYYFLQYVSWGSQYDGMYVVILDKDGNIINSFEDVTFSYDKNKKEYQVSKQNGLDSKVTNTYKLLDEKPYKAEGSITPRKENESFTVGDLKIDFTGYNLIDDAYTYSAKITINGKKVDNTILDNPIIKNNVDIYMINNKYIIVSKNDISVYLLVLNELGNIILENDNLTDCLVNDNELKLMQDNSTIIYNLNDHTLTFSLNDNFVSLNVDKNLKLEFNGEEDTNNNPNYYKYVLKMKLNGEELDNKTLFENNNDKFIWSESYAASFEVQISNNYYLLISEIGSEVNGNYLLVLDKKGKLVNSYKDVTIEKADNKINIYKCSLNIDCSDKIIDTINLGN